MTTRTGSLESLTEDECFTLLSTTTVGHVAFVDPEGQQLIPVNFAVLDGMIYFRTDPSSVLSQLARGHQDVAFGIENQDVFRQGWNVTARGTAIGVEDRATINKVLGYRRLHPWAGGVRPMVIKIAPSLIAGRRVNGNTT